MCKGTIHVRGGFRGGAGGAPLFWVTKEKPAAQGKQNRPYPYPASLAHDLDPPLTLT